MNKLVIFLSCFLLISCSQGVATHITYYDFLSDKTLLFDIENKKFSNGHRIENLFICPKEYDLICIIGGPAFVVPRNFDPNLKEWEFEKRNFKNLGDEKLKLLGKEYLVYRIEYADSGGWLWYLYSKNFGVLALGSREGEEIQNVYLLQSRCGLGASDSC
jgi:hypothetical protein